MEKSIDTIKRVEEEYNPYKKIERKAQIIIGIKDFIKENETLGLDDLRNKISEYKNKIESQFSPDTVEKKNELQKLLEKQSTLLINPYEEITENKLDEHEEMEDKINLIYREDEESGSFNILFLEKIDDFLNGVIDLKEAAIRGQEIYNLDKESILAKINLQKEDVVDAQFHGLSSNIIVKEKPFMTILNRTSIDKRGHNDIMGMHLPGSNINIIRYVDEGHRDAMLATIKHEEMHTLQEAFLSKPNISPDKFSEQVKKIVQKIESMQQSGDPLYRGIINSSRDRLHKKISEFTKLNSNELIADLDSMAEGNLNTYYAYILDTATSLRNLLSDLKKEDGLSEETRVTIEEGLNEFKNNSVSCLVELSNLFYVAKKVDKLEELKSLFILFGQEKLDIIKKSLQHMAPESELYYELLPIIQKEHHIKFSAPSEENKAADRLMAGMGMARPLSDEINEEIEKKENNPYTIFIPSQEKIKKVVYAFNRLKRRGLEAHFSQEEMNTSHKNLRDFLDFEEYKSFKKGLSEVLDSKEKILSYNQFVEELLNALDSSKLLEKYKNKVYVLPFIESIKDGLINGNFQEATKFFNDWPFEKNILYQSIREYLLPSDDDDFFEGEKETTPSGEDLIMTYPEMSDFLKKINFTYNKDIER
jgi:hypothetical protein